MLKDTLLDSVEAVVLSVKDLLSPLEVKIVLTVDTPREIYDRTQVLHLYREVRALGVEALCLAELLLEGLCYGVTPELVCALLAELFDLIISTSART